MKNYLNGSILDIQDCFEYISKKENGEKTANLYIRLYINKTEYLKHI